MSKPIKPIFTNSLYSVIRQGSRWVVVLSSNFSSVQFSGARDWCISWARDNDISIAQTA
jgi:hypothetical protein